MFTSCICVLYDSRSKKHVYFSWNVDTPFFTAVLDSLLTSLLILKAMAVNSLQSTLLRTRWGSREREKIRMKRKERRKRSRLLGIYRERESASTTSRQASHEYSTRRFNDLRNAVASSVNYHNALGRGEKGEKFPCDVIFYLYLVQLPSSSLTPACYGKVERDSIQIPHTGILNALISSSSFFLSFLSFFFIVLSTSNRIFI